MSTGWPDAERPGVPINPEQDGWHFLHHPEDLRPVPTPWDSEHAAWCSSGMHSPQGVMDLGYNYLGPCLTPAEVAALVEEARREGAAEEREACAAWHEDAARHAEKNKQPALCAHHYAIAAAIRARGAA